MAAFHHQRSGSRISYNGGSIGEQQLPAGSCNFRDLSIGARAPICGCKRFWLNNSQFNGPDGISDKAWCFCGHHACFHNALSQRQRSFGQASVGAVRSNIAEGVSMTAEAGREVVQASGYQSKPTGLGIRPDSSGEDQSINTRLWDALNAFAREQEDGTGSGMMSKLPSTACPSIAGDFRPSPNRTLLERTQQLRSMGPPVNIPSNLMAAPAEEYSATEVATPSANGTPDLRAFAPPGSQARISPASRPATRAATSPPSVRARQTTEVAQPSGSGQNGQQFPASSMVPALSLQEATSMLRTFGQRIDVLETLSFSHMPVEEVQDRLELFDGRVLDLEQWRAEHEQAHPSPEPADPESSKRRRLLPTEVSSFASDGSFDSAAAAQTEAVVLATLAANAETGPRIDLLESRVAGLESAALPSFVRPWHVQIVLLPWGRDLRGIWFSALEATQHSLKSSTQTSDEWTGAQSAPRLSYKSSASGAWTTESIQAWADEAQEWLSPKACGPAGMVFERLASRGLVRDVTFTAPDSLHILDTLSNAFGTFRRSAEDARLEQTGSYQALRENFVPLRKVRKSSRLRFLSPAEMVTSAMWTARFLDSSVFMKVNDGQRRLYVTTPAAYLQPSGECWSWQRLRHLPIHEASGQEQAAQATNAAIEACWTYNDRLDQPTSAHASFASHASRDSQWSTRSQQSDHEEASIDDRPVSPESGPRLSHHRTVSLPSSSSAAEQAKASLPKRRVASFETAATVPSNDDQMATTAAGKRRRISTSPEAERRGVGLTPRWSREPPSPYTSEHAGEARSQGAFSRKRGTTPFAYATPHSNSNYNVPRMDFIGGDGDTEADTDMVAPHSERGEDEWHGVEEELSAGMDQSDGGSAMDEVEIDEANPDMGTTICER